MRYAPLLLLIVSFGCDANDSDQAAPTSSSDSQEQAHEDTAKQANDNTRKQADKNTAKQAEVLADGTLNEPQVAALLSKSLGEWEGTAVIKGKDGKLQAEFPITSSCRWLEEGKSIEIRLTEKLPQGDQQLIFTKWYDPKQQRFLLTRRMAGDEAPPKPGAYETYDPATGIFHGIVTEALAAGVSWTWTSQVADKSDLLADGTLSVYTGTFKKEGIVQTTRIDTLIFVGPEAETP